MTIHYSFPGKYLTELWNVKLSTQSIETDYNVLLGETTLSIYQQTPTTFSRPVKPPTPLTICLTVLTQSNWLHALAILDISAALDTINDSFPHLNGSLLISSWSCNTNRNQFIRVGCCSCSAAAVLCRFWVPLGFVLGTLVEDTESAINLATDLLQLSHASSPAMVLDAPETIAGLEVLSTGSMFVQRRFLLHMNCCLALTGMKHPVRWLFLIYEEGYCRKIQISFGIWYRHPACFQWT